jgi:uroporphyrinogen decarboxylase
VGAVLCAKTGPLTSKAMIEEFEFPSLRQRVEMVKRKGLPVSIHQDGNVTSLYPDFLQMGIDVINPIECCDGAQDIYQLKQTYGRRIALHGNIDLGLLASGTPSQVKADVIEHIDRLAAGGGYVCQSSHNITEAIPVKNFYAMRDAVHDHRFRAKS